MGTYVKATATKMVPIIYTCVECGKQNLDISIVTGEGSSRVKLIHDDSHEVANQAAGQAALSNYTDLTQKVGNKSFGNLTCVGKCSGCGTTQPWATGKLRNAMDKATIPIMVAIFVLICVYEAVVEKRLQGALVIGAAFLAFFGGSILILVLRFIMEFVYKAISASGTSKMIKNGKEHCFPRIHVTK